MERGGDLGHRVAHGDLRACGVGGVGPVCCGGGEGPEQGVLGFGECGFDQCADVGGCVVAQGEPAVVVVGHGQLRGCAGAVLFQGVPVPGGRVSSGAVGGGVRFA